MFVTHESDPVEAKVICSLRPGVKVTPDAFHSLTLNEAVLLPGAPESKDRIRRFRLAPRLNGALRAPDQSYSTCR